MKSFDIYRVFETARKTRIIKPLTASRFRRVILPAILAAAFLLASFFPPLNNLISPTGSARANMDESIATFASDCMTPKSEWDLGGTACAQVTDAPDDRRIAWVAPNGIIAQVSGFFSGSGSDTYNIPTGTHPFAQVGTWEVVSIDVNGVASAFAEFVVKDPANASVNLSVGSFGSFQTSAGNNISYRVEVTNRGPNDAQNVVLTNPVPGSTSFVSESQDSGPIFTCTAPTAGSTTGAISCTIATLPANDTAIFTFVFDVDAGAANGATIINAVSVSSDTNELHEPDNSASSSSTVVAATAACTVNCPSVAPVSTAQCSAVVNYANPTTSGDCDAGEEGSSGVVCNPPSGSTFSIGSTTVTCTTPTGNTCSFAVTVDYTGPTGGLAITCPADVTVNADSVSGGTALVNYPAPTTNGNCVTVVCTPPSGTSFFVGTTTVNCTASDPANNTASCSFDVTVTGEGGGCMLSCPGDVTQNAAAGQCSAVVTYSAPTTSGSCGTVTCSPPSGSTFNVGSTVVVCTDGAGADCDFIVNVIPASPPVIMTCATDKTIPVVSNCEALIPNLISEVVATGCNVTISQSPAAGTPVGPGTHTVTITAENAAGEATCTATVTVTDGFSGFFQPVANLPTVNVVNAGRAVPVKFSLGGDMGLNIFASGYPISVQLDCNSGDPTSDVEETVTAGGSSLSYNASTDTYTYTWKTESSWAGTCRQLIIRFANGCEHVANFKFR